MQTHPMKIPGRWRDGYALDYHTVSSVYLGDDEFGHAQYDTTRSDAGELLYQLKYKDDQNAVEPLVQELTSFVGRWRIQIDLIIPVPPSRQRALQPVFTLSSRLSAGIGVACVTDAVARTKDVPELKGVYEYDERVRLLAGAHSVDESRVRGRRILLFDDLYRSGATMNAITVALYDDGGAADVFALTITRTRSNR